VEPALCGPKEEVEVSRLALESEAVVFWLAANMDVSYASFPGFEGDGRPAALLERLFLLTALNLLGAAEFKEVCANCLSRSA